MKRTTVFLPDSLTRLLDAQSQQTGAPVAELVRRALAAVIPAPEPPKTAKAGDLRKRIDKVGQMTYGLVRFDVLVLDARQGYLLIEPVEGDGQQWVDADRVSFPAS